MTPKAAGTIRLVIADDHTMFLEGIVRLLEGAGDLEIVGRAVTGEELLERVATEDPDIALVDISMPGPGLTAILDRIRESGSACRVIALTMHLERSFAFEMIDKGLAGYVTKDAVFSEVLEAIRSVAAGKTYLCRQIAFPGDPEAPFSDLLTPREMQCFKLAAQGLTNKAIAQQLDISDRTAKFHLENIYHKLGAERRGEAVAKARAKGIVV